MRALVVFALLVCVTASAEDKEARAAESKKSLSAIKAVAEPRGRARLAAADISERGLGVHPDLLLVLAAVADTNPDDCAELVARGLDETSGAAVKKRCGKSVAELKKLPAKSLAGACKLDRKAPAEPWSQLLSAVVAEEIAADKAASPDEQQIAQALSGLCPVAAK